MANKYEIVLMSPDGLQLVALPETDQYWALNNRSAHIVSLPTYVKMLVQEGWTVLGML